jgi:hypothetical protein
VSRDLFPKNTFLEDKNPISEKIVARNGENHISNHFFIFIFHIIIKFKKKENVNVTSLGEGPNVTCHQMLHK